VPLTVSPFITLPKPPTLPHNYATLPSTLPPSILNNTDNDNNNNNNNNTTQTPYVTSGTGFRAHPSTIIAQNNALHQQLATAASQGKAKIKDWQREIDERELADKRRKAPGWLDSDAKILRPESRTTTKTGGAAVSVALPVDTRAGAMSLLDGHDDADAGSLSSLNQQQQQQLHASDMGAQMDRAFG
jgi:hypothetical protein